MIPDRLADAAEMVALRALQFGEIERTACQHPDGRKETDATHTVMLTWLAPALADLLYPDLDPVLVTAFAAVHDAVEVFAGDTPTLRITEAGRQDKEAREAAAEKRWHWEFDPELPWLPAMISRYERQLEPEARFTRAVDKILPGLVHFSNGARDLHEYGMTAAEQDSSVMGGLAGMREYAADFPALIELRGIISRRLTVLLASREPAAAGIRSASWSSRSS